ncbi:MAG: DUF5801 domain-containing protein [Burkholderiaceae bacterium]|nr:DUF5801 domain-containing protein [Burkholderiaceae bacterium]
MPLDGDDSGLFTLDGQPIYLYTDTLDPALLLGKTADGDVVLAAYIEIQTGSEPGVMMWTALYEPLQHPDPMDPDEAVDLTDRVFIRTGSQTTYDLSDVKPGQYLFFITGNENAALVYTGKEPANQSEGELVNNGDTVNPSAATTTTVGTNNQMIDPPTYDKFGEVVKPAEGVVVSFVRGANPAYTGVNLSPGEAVVEANIQFTSMIDAYQASFVVSQLQPVKSSTVEVSAWHTEAESGTQFVDGLLVDDTRIHVTRVTVYDENGIVLEDSDGSVQSSDIEITIIDGVANIAGINPGYQIEYYTDQAHNRVLIENAGSRNENLNASFDLGAFTLVQTSSTVTEIGSAMIFEDDGVTVSPNETVYIDDDALPNGNPGGVDDQNPDQVAVTGTLSHTAGNDQPFSIAWLTDGAPAGFTYEASGSDLLVKQGAVTVLTLSLDTATGAYAVTQNASIMHELGMDENDVSFRVGYRVTDADGDSADGSISINVDDDTPTVSENATVYLDDDAMTGGNAGGIGDQEPDVVAATGTLGHSFGADQPGSIAWLTNGAPAGFTYEASGSDLLVKQGAVTVLTLSLDAATGAYAVTQNAAIMHELGMDENDQAFTVSYRVTDADGDSADGMLSLIVNDDTPTVTVNATVYLDDDALMGGNPGGVDDQDPDVVAATGTLGHSFGADQPGSIAWLTDGAPAGFTYEASGSDLLVKQGAVTVLTLSLDTATGAYSVVQNAPVQHDTAFDENEAAFEVGYRVSDADGDSVDGVLSIVVDDDTPVVNEVTGATYFNNQNPSPGAFGVFDYSVGADSRTEFAATNTDLLMFRLTGTVGVNSITNSSILWVSESDETALFRIGFDYQPSESSVDISSASGYIEFDKVQGTYQFWLDEPLQGYSISTTSSAIGFTGYEVNSETTDKTQPVVVVAQLNDSLYAQFTGYSEPGGGTGVNNLQALGVDTDPGTFVNGEQFVQAASYVSVSNVANGVAGDTLQKGEVLNFTLYNSNPYGYLGHPATQYAESMFLKFDGIGSTEDLVVILSLINPDTMDQTTRALIVDSSDILKFGNTITPEYRIVLDNNDGAIIIESNDFNAPGESYLITGAQVLVSVEGVAGEGIEFNSLIGEQGASTTTRAFGASETDSDVIKISDIGLMTQSSATLSAELQIDLAVIDTDFDASVTQAIDISILGSAMAPLDSAV